MTEEQKQALIALAQNMSTGQVAASMMQPLHTRRAYAAHSLGPSKWEPLPTNSGWDEWPFDLLTAERVVPASGEEINDSIRETATNGMDRSSKASRTRE